MSEQVTGVVDDWVSQWVNEKVSEQVTVLRKLLIGVVGEWIGEWLDRERLLSVMQFRRVFCVMAQAGYQTCFMFRLHDYA